MQTQTQKVTPKNLTAGDVITVASGGVDQIFDGQDDRAYADRYKMRADASYTVDEVTTVDARTRANTGRRSTRYVVRFIDGRSVTVGAAQRFVLVDPAF